MRKQIRWILPLLIIAAVLVSVGLHRAAQDNATAGKNELSAKVVTVIDGDTFNARIDEHGRIERVRVIGIDTPELARAGSPDQPYAQKAKQQARTLLSSRRVLLRLDRANEQRSHRDKYGRLLAHVELPDGSDFSELMIEQGLAEVIRHFDYDQQLKQHYLEVEQQARDREIGIWANQHH